MKASGQSTPPAMPKGITNAYWFQIFNASSWSIFLGTPMLLYLKSLNASAAVLGATVAMTPLFAALQIPAADYAERAGLKLFVVRGWASRSIFILGVVVIALLPESITPGIRIGLTLAMMACFAATRGISVCGYLPWITQIVPEARRGAFMARDTMCMYLALAGTLLLSSVWVGAFPGSRAFAALFILSYLAALVSVVFLRRIPDPPPPEPRAQRDRPPWLAMVRYPPFFKYLIFTIGFNLFISALSVIWVPFMKDGTGASGGLILGLSAYSSVLCAGISRITGPILDRTGSRPLMAFASGLILISQSAWMAIAAGALPARPAVYFLIVPIGAAGYTIINLAGSRLLMGLIPALGRSHFFAISSVAVSLTQGMMPIIWGFALDSLNHRIGPGFCALPGWAWNSYSLFFAGIVTGTLAVQFLRRRLDEPRAMSTEEFLRILLVQSPLRLVNWALSPLRNIQLPGGG